MNNFEVVEKWAERIYTDTDFGRGIAVSISGITGLTAYLLTKDWVIAAFASVILFPISRLITTALHNKSVIRKLRSVNREEAKYKYENLSPGEQNIVQSFIDQGGFVLTWKVVNRLELNHSSVESLVQRGLLHPSVTADGMVETFVLDEGVYDAGIKADPLDAIL